MTKEKPVIIQCPACNGTGNGPAITREMALDGGCPEMEGTPSFCLRCGRSGVDVDIVALSEISQDEYCRDCLCLPGCNVMLKDGEICGDMILSPADMSYDEWESLGDNVPPAKAGGNLI